MIKGLFLLTYRLYASSKFFKVVLEVNLMLLDESGFVYLVCCLHCKLSFEYIQHIVSSGVSVAILIHQLFHHFAIYEDIVHAFLKVG